MRLTHAWTFDCERSAAERETRPLPPQVQPQDDLSCGNNSNDLDDGTSNTRRSTRPSSQRTSCRQYLACLASSTENEFDLVITSPTSIGTNERRPERSEPGLYPAQTLRATMMRAINPVALSDARCCCRTSVYLATDVLPATNPGLTILLPPRPIEDRDEAARTYGSMYQAWAAS